MLVQKKFSPQFLLVAGGCFLSQLRLCHSLVLHLFMASFLTLLPVRRACRHLQITFAQAFSLLANLQHSSLLRCQLSCLYVIEKLSNYTPHHCLMSPACCTALP